MNEVNKKVADLIAFLRNNNVAEEEIILICGKSVCTLKRN